MSKRKKSDGNSNVVIRRIIKEKRIKHFKIKYCEIGMLGQMKAILVFDTNTDQLLYTVCNLCNGSSKKECIKSMNKHYKDIMDRINTTGSVLLGDGNSNKIEDKNAVDY